MGIEGRRREMDIRREEDRRRLIPRDREVGFFCSSFSDSVYVKNLLVCNEYHYELTFLTRVLSTLAAPLWINVLIVVYLILI